MSILNARPLSTRKNLKEVAFPIGLVLLWITVLILITSLTQSAYGQTFVTQPTTVTLWAGSEDIFQFGVTQFTLPSSGVILSGTAISTITGQPVRHLWIGDAINGLCRIDPEVDEVVPPTAGIAGHSLNVLTCTGGTQERAITPAQLAFDAATNTLYLGNISRLGGGILRLHYIPSGDNGQGSFNHINIESLIGTGTARDQFGGCPAVKDPKSGTLVPVIPDSVALGPDGNLYTGSIRDGAIIRIISPATFNPATDCPGNGGSGVTPGPNDKIQIPILSPDQAIGTGHNFGLGWIGHTLVGGDNAAPWIKFNADQCFTSANGNTVCGNPLTGGAPLPTEILATQAGAPQGATITDAQYPTFPGTTAYFASFPSVTKVTNIVDASNLTVQTNYGGTFSFITGLTADPTNNQFLYVAADPAQGGVNGAGQIWQVSTQPCPPGVALTPVNVTATASVSDQATVHWSEPVSNCQTITSYVVRTLLAGGTASGVPDFTVTATPPAVPPPTATITGLTNGTSYQFEVEACDLAGCSAFSALSNVASLTPPAAPTGVVATLAGTSANVSWRTLADSSVTSYTVSAFDSATPGVAVATVTVSIQILNGQCPSCGFPVITGLLGGHTYTFTVHATNVFGNGPESAPSLPVTVPLGADVSASMTAPATVSIAGAMVTYNLRVTNNGPLDAAEVTFSETLPAPLVSFSTTQGMCTGTLGTTGFSCNLNSMIAGSTATVAITVQLPASQSSGSFTNSITVNATNAAGGNIDPNLANNTASATVTVDAPCAPATTDLQTTGSAQNGNPVHGAPDTFTWQIKNNQGNTAASCSTFIASTTAPTGDIYTINSASTTQGTCSIANNQLSCNLGTIAGGATVTVTVIATPSAAAPANSYSMTGSANFTGTDTNTANNSSTVLIGAQ